MQQQIPDIDRCRSLMEEFSMWENIRHHSFLVARVAELLQQHLLATGRARTVPGREMIIAGALLHDIAKSKCLKENCRHAEVGATICEELGYPQIAEIVANHVILSGFAPERYAHGEFTAAELVFYADKRVKHDQVVTLDERLAYILEKYADNLRHEALILENFQSCRTLEQHLFSCLDFTPTEVAGLLANSPAGVLEYQSILPAATQPV